MRPKVMPITKSWFVRGLLLLPLVAALGWAPVSQVAAAGCSSIGVLAPGAAAGAAVDVQYLDLHGNWVAVDNWKSHLDALGSGEPFKSWSVFSQNYGQGPFRWVIFNADGTTIYGI